MKSFLQCMGFQQKQQKIPQDKSLEVLNKKIKNSMYEDYKYYLSEYAILLNEEKELPSCNYYTDERFKKVVYDRIMMEKNLINAYEKIVSYYDDDIVYMAQIVNPYKYIKQLHKEMKITSSYVEI